MNRRNFVAAAAATIIGMFLPRVAKPKTVPFSYACNLIPVSSIENKEEGIVVWCGYASPSKHTYGLHLKPKTVDEIISMALEGREKFYGIWLLGERFGFIDYSGHFKERGFGNASEITGKNKC